MDREHKGTTHLQQDFTLSGIEDAAIEGLAALIVANWKQRWTNKMPPDEANLMASVRTVLTSLLQAQAAIQLAVLPGSGATLTLSAPELVGPQIAAGLSPMVDVLPELFKQLTRLQASRSTLAIIKCRQCNAVFQVTCDSADEAYRAVQDEHRGLCPDCQRHVQ